MPNCAACGETFTEEEWVNRESAVHSGPGGLDVHERCCETCHRRSRRRTKQLRRMVSRAYAWRGAGEARYRW